MNSLIDRITSIVKEATPAYPNVSIKETTGSSSITVIGRGRISYITDSDSSYKIEIERIDDVTMPSYVYLAFGGVTTVEFAKNITFAPDSNVSGLKLLIQLAD